MSRFMSVEESKRLAELNERVRRARELDGDTVKPAAPTAAEIRAAANDDARHRARDRDWLACDDAEQAFALEDARQCDAEERRLIEHGRIAGSEALQHWDSGEDF